MRLKEAKQKYKGEWLAFQVKKEGKKDLEGKVITHAKTRRKLHEKLINRKINKVYVTYARPAGERSYPVIFYEENKT